MSATLPVLYVVRHGETEWSLSGRHTGLTDPPLTARGERDAVGLRGRLQTMTFDRVLTSPLQRAARTKFEGRLFTFQIIANIVVLGALLGLMLVSTIRISDLNQRQLDAVKVQNTAQICAQADIVSAVRQIARSLGLPTQNIVPPDTEGLACPSEVSSPPP